MIRHLIPRVALISWTGCALTTDRIDGEPSEATGYVVCVQWLGLMVEIGAGRVR